MNRREDRHVDRVPMQLEILLIDRNLERAVHVQAKPFAPGDAVFQPDHP